MLMKTKNAVNDLSPLFPGGNFDLEAWKAYAASICPGLAEACIRDMEECIATGKVNFQDNYLPVLNDVIRKREALELAVSSFEAAVRGLEQKITKTFGRCPDTEIILYLGLCNAAGWVTKLNGKTYVLLGIEKILELNWCDLISMYGLIYHELGHVYQEQFGVLERELSSNREKFLWQLFTEGIAMYFEQALVENFDFFHQDRDGWKDWCEENLPQIKADFAADLDTMTFENQRYFGDWVYYCGYNDVGYYLGARFVQFICEKYRFNDILSFEIAQVEALFSKFLTRADSPIFEIETERLLLRKLSPGDKEDVFEILSDEQTCLDDGGFHAFQEQDEEFNTMFAWMQTQKRYAIVLKHTQKMIGLINLQDEDRAVPAYELGFVLNLKYRRQGYAYEAIQSLITAWFAQADVEMFTASHFPYNEASKKLIQKLGFTWEGNERKALRHAVYGPIDLVCYYKEKGTQ